MTDPLTFHITLPVRPEDIRAHGVQGTIDRLCLDVEAQMRRLLPAIEALEHGILPSGRVAPWATDPDEGDGTLETAE